MALISSGVDKMSLDLKIKKGLEISLITPKDKVAGLFCLDIIALNYNASFHFLMRKSHRKLWGYEESWYNGPLYFLGCGPLFLFCAMEHYED